MWGIDFSFITKAIAWFTGSPLVASVVGALINDFKEHGDEILQFALDAVKEAANAGEGVDRFALVKEKVEAKFPDVSQSLLNTSIEAAYRYFKTT